MASVRGMGVALMLSWCGTMRPRTVSPSWSAPGAGPPKRCCSSTMDRPSGGIRHGPGSAPACRPPARALGHGGGSRRALAVRLPVIQAMFTPSGCNHAASLRKCCSARISVAPSAPPGPRPRWPGPRRWPRPRSCRATSPCNRRCIGYGCARSAAISRTTRCCAPVNLNAGFRTAGPPAVRRVAGRQRRGFLDARAAGGGQRHAAPAARRTDAPPCR